VVIKSLTQILAVLSVVASFESQAHHSFAIFDIDNKIQRSGILTKFEFRNPHVTMELSVQRDDGSKETWVVESGATRRWASFGLDASVAAVGEAVTILGWPARDGSDVMVLSTIITERGTTVYWEEIEQKRARDDIPEVTIKRE
jgi:hypothetical protein